MEILVNSEAVHRRLGKLFSRRTRGRRRVILAAYVGADAPTLLPDFHGVELYCWPQVGATNPVAVAELMQSSVGASVHFVDKLHAKLYWVEGEGFVIGSANLTRNALGSGGLHEIALFDDDASSVDIDGIISQYTVRRPTTTELAALQVEHDRFWSGLPESKRARVPTIDFAAWSSLRGVRPWKLTWWDEEGDEARSSTERAEAEGVDSIADFIPCREGDFASGDWVLTFKRTRNGIGPIAWMLVELVSQLEPAERDADNPGWTHEALQLRAYHSPIRPPFALNPQFKQAFVKAAEAYGLKDLRERDDVNVPPGFLKRLLAAYS